MRIIQWILLCMIPPILDFVLDYNNGFRALTSSSYNMAPPTRAIHWTMFLNVVLTPVIAAIFNRDERIETFLTKFLGIDLPWKIIFFDLVRSHGFLFLINPSRKNPLF